MKKIVSIWTFVLITMVASATAVAVGPPVEILLDYTVVKRFQAESGANTYRFIPTGVAPEPTLTQALAINLPNDGTNAKKRCQAVFLESSFKFYYVAYLSNGTTIGSLTYPILVDTTFAGAGLYAGGGALGAINEACWALVTGELDSIWVREATETDTVNTWCLFK